MPLFCLEVVLSVFKNGKYYGENQYKNTFNSIHAEVCVMKKVARYYSDKSKKQNKKKFNMMVIKISKTGSKLGMSRLCERCVLAVNNIHKKTGIKINKIYYSNHDGGIVKTTPNKLLKRTDHHVSRFYKNTGYKPSLCCCTELEINDEDDELTN